MGAGAIAIGLILIGACGGSTDSNAGSGGSSTQGGSSAKGGSSGSGATAGSGASAGTGAGAGTGATGGAGAGGTSSGGGGSGGGPPDWFACGDASQCQLFANNCCGGYCSEQPITGWTAINSSHQADYQAAHCDPAGACPGCIGPPIPNYAAVCRAGQCVAIDVRDDELSACTADTDCVLRWGSGCCQACSGSDANELTAVSKNADFQSAVCGSAVPPCCAPLPFPSNAHAACANGHCAVVTALGGP